MRFFVTISLFLAYCTGFSQELIPSPINVKPLARHKTYFKPADVSFFAANIPIQISVAPGIGTNPVYGTITNQLSLNLSIADDDRINGLQVSLLSGQISRSLTGVQVSGGTSIVNDLSKGVQTSFFYNSAEGKATGLQVTAGMNHALIVEGMQMGLLNNAVIGTGIQSGGINVVHRDFTGLQAGLVNFAGGAGDYQAGLVNVADSSVAMQFGIINRSGKVDDLQLGVINWSDENDGTALGLINMIRDGRNNLEMSMNEKGMENFRYRTGSKRFQIFYQVGKQTDMKPFMFSVGTGVSFRKPFEWFNLGYEISVHKVSFNRLWDNDLQVLLTNELVTDVNLLDWLRLFAGVSYNVYGDDQQTGHRIISGTNHYDPVAKAWYRFGWGYSAGISLF